MSSQPEKINKKNIDKYSSNYSNVFKNSEKVQIVLDNDRVTAYFFLDQTLKDIFKKSASEIETITRTCENEGKCDICLVSKPRALKLLKKVNELKLYYIGLSEAERRPFGVPTYNDGSIENLTYRIENAK